MPRRGQVEHHRVDPDSKYNSLAVAQFINRVMERGKKTVAEKLVYDALGIIEDKTKKPPLEIFETALRKAVSKISSGGFLVLSSMMPKAS